MEGQACTVVVRFGKNHPARVRECHHRRCTEAAIEGSTGDAVMVAEEVRAERRGETGGGDEGRRGGCGHRRHRTEDVGEERDGEKMVGNVSRLDCRAGRDLKVSLEELAALGIRR